ncbi:Polygalacturonase-1 non-catalytic subunit beta [Sesamum angolense]|uniref:Polygalacturonase-1 non-catalytic subunit beta n=1 Tax=Sesamum angolense TaxID=2727404 RepID=A0AAE1X0D6_9LAMI|nr:Polygalacturonase-1 non-catalytic subunit beta [Sesamum angolense]
MQVVAAAAGESNAGENPFTPKGYVMRYWKKQISNDLPKPEFLLKKASPLNAAQYAAFSKLADQNLLSTRLPDFCSEANLLCFPDLSPSLEKARGKRELRLLLEQELHQLRHGSAWWN